MFQNDLLDIGIGLVFVWFVLSLVISVVNDGIALLFRIRAKNLWLGIDRLLNPKTGKYARHLWDVVIFLPLSMKDLDVRPVARSNSSDEPTLSGLNSKPGHDERQQELQMVYDALAPMVTDVAISGRKSKLTKVSGAVFADAIASLAKPVFPADLMVAANTVGWIGDRLKAVQQVSQNLPADQAIDLDLALGLDFGASVTDDDKARLFEKASEHVTLRDVVAIFHKNPDLQRSLTAALRTTGLAAKAEAVKSTVEIWFDREMEQASALYRRQNRKILAILAVPVVMIFQANTLGIISDLREDSALRAVVASQAIAAVDAGTLTAVAAKHCPLDGPGQVTGGEDPLEKAAHQFECAGLIIRSATDFELVPDLDKIMAYDETQGLSVADAWHYEFSDWGWLGRSITIVALMFGAQFWFDTLRRLVGIRKSISGSGGSSAG